MRKNWIQLYFVYFFFFLNRISSVFALSTEEIMNKACGLDTWIHLDGIDSYFATEINEFLTLSIAMIDMNNPGYDPKNPSHKICRNSSKKFELIRLSYGRFDSNQRCEKHYTHLEFPQKPSKDCPFIIDLCVITMGEGKRKFPKEYLSPTDNLYLSGMGSGNNGKQKKKTFRFKVDKDSSPPSNIGVRLLHPPEYKYTLNYYFDKMISDLCPSTDYEASTNTEAVESRESGGTK